MQKNQIYILLILMIFTSCDLKTAEQYYTLAYDFEEQGKYKEAIKMLDKAIEKKPDLKPVLLNRGADKSLLEDYKGAIEDYQKILKYDPDNTIALMNIGNNYKRLDKNRKAIEFYSKALKTKGAIKSDSIYLELNIFNEGEKDSDYYVRKNEIKYERGISFAKNGQYKLAIKDFEQVVKYDYERGSALVWLGESYLNLYDTVKAKKNLVEAAKLEIIDAKELLNKIN